MHRDPRLTFETYGHLLPDYLRGEVKALRFAIEAGEAADKGAAGAHGAMVVPWAKGARNGAGLPAANCAKSPAINLERETGFEPATLSLGS